MGTASRLGVLIVLTFSLLSIYQVKAQTGEVIVSSDLELLSLGDVSGGGRITWLLTGEQATELRVKILRMYDERMNWPRGFAFECQVTGATTTSVANGVLESAEVTSYLAHLENELEGVLRPVLGTEFRFVRVTRADRAEQDLPAEASSSGLVGTTNATSQGIEIRFIFNANTRSLGRAFDQMNITLANAVHNVFTFEAFDDTSLQGCPSPWFPFPALGGWWRVPPPSQFPPGQFLWHGNRSAVPWVDQGAYEPGARNETGFSSDSFQLTRLDLRFASNANLTFDHSGGAAPGDVLLVQVSADRIAWQNVTAVGDQNAPVDTFPTNVLGSSTFDLSPWLGQQPYVRLLFTANGDATTSGFGYFVRNIRVDAPSRVQGQIDHRHIDLVVGFLSFSNFRTTDVGAHLIRTPVGEVMFYNARYSADDPPGDSARFAAFDFVENPQILFVILAVSWWLLGLFQGRFYERFRIDHPVKMRAGVAKTKWVHWIGKVTVLLLTLFYFFPTMLGAGLFASGLAFWVMCITSVVGVSGFTWFWYDRRAKQIPPEPELEPGEHAAAGLLPPSPLAEAPMLLMVCATCGADIEDVTEAYRCPCGETYHKPHAEELGTCGNCGRKLQVVPEPVKAMVTIKCPWCSELQMLEEGTILKVTRCEDCRMVLEEIPTRYNYLVITEDPVLAYDWLKAVVRTGVPGLVMSTTFPEKLKREFELADGVELYWLSDTSPGPRTLDPRRLDFEIMRALSNFVKNNKGGALVLDGIEYLVVENSFDRVLKFVKKVNDLASVHDATMFVPITPTGLGPEEMTLLRKEFDKVETVASKT
jgi:DNA-directed RNA polymerase subunit RPC12/RpoP